MVLPSIDFPPRPVHAVRRPRARLRRRLPPTGCTQIRSRRSSSTRAGLYRRQRERQPTGSSSTRGRKKSRHCYRRSGNLSRGRYYLTKANNSDNCSRGSSYSGAWRRANGDMRLSYSSHNGRSNHSSCPCGRACISSSSRRRRPQHLARSNL